MRPKKYFFSKKKSNFFLKKFFFPNFSNSCSLNIVEPKIWRRLGTFLSCFSKPKPSHTTDCRSNTYLIMNKLLQLYTFNVPCHKKSASLRLTFYVRFLHISEFPCEADVSKLFKSYTLSFFSCRLIPRSADVLFLQLEDPVDCWVLYSGLFGSEKNNFGCNQD